MGITSNMASLCSLCSQISFLDLPPYPQWLGGRQLVIKDSELIPFVPKEPSPEDQSEKEEDEETLVAIEEAEGLHHVFPNCFYPLKEQGYHKEPVPSSEEEGGLRHIFPS